MSKFLFWLTLFCWLVEKLFVLLLVLLKFRSKFVEGDTLLTDGWFVFVGCPKISNINIFIFYQEMYCYFYFQVLWIQKCLKINYLYFLPGKTVLVLVSALLDPKMSSNVDDGPNGDDWTDCFGFCSTKSISSGETLLPAVSLALLPGFLTEIL